jgi:hypothetical protein
MNKTLVIFLIFFYLTGCFSSHTTTGPATQTPIKNIEATPKKDIIEQTISKNLLNKIAKTINKNTTEITKADLLQVEDFSFTFDDIPAEERSLPNKEPIDLSIIGEMKNLKKLTLIHISVSDFKFLTSLSKLENLNIVDFRTEQLPDLKTFTSLKSLTLSNGDLKDIKFFESLPNLQQLDISQNPVQNITPLISLKNLIELELQGTQIKSAKPLTQLHSLRTISINKNVKDINLLIAEANLTITLVVSQK